MLFQRPFHPSKEKKSIYIRWGKHWTEMFLDLSLVVSQKQCVSEKMTIIDKKKVQSNRFHCNAKRSFILVCISWTSSVFCAVVVSSHVPCLTALPKDSSHPQAALTSTWYCQCWLVLFVCVNSYPLTIPLFFLTKPPHQFCRQTLLFFVNVFFSLFVFPDRKSVV